MVQVLGMPREESRCMLSKRKRTASHTDQRPLFLPWLADNFVLLQKKLNWEVYNNIYTNYIYYITTSDHLEGKGQQNVVLSPLAYVIISLFVGKYDKDLLENFKP